MKTEALVDANGSTGGFKDIEDNLREMLLEEGATSAAVMAVA